MAIAASARVCSGERCARAAAATGVAGSEASAESAESGVPGVAGVGPGVSGGDVSGVPSIGVNPNPDEGGVPRLVGVRSPICASGSGESGAMSWHSALCVTLPAAPAAPRAVSGSPPLGKAHTPSLPAVRLMLGMCGHAAAAAVACAGGGGGGGMAAHPQH